MSRRGLGFRIAGVFSAMVAVIWMDPVVESFVPGVSKCFNFFRVGRVSGVLQVALLRRVTPGLDDERRSPKAHPLLELNGFAGGEVRYGSSNPAFWRSCFASIASPCASFSAFWSSTSSAS
jgi:hypothetical protein